MVRRRVAVSTLGLMMASAAVAGIEALDDNRNELLEPSELTAAGLFEQFDANQDGVLVPDELSRAPSPTSGWDVDGDSRLSETEFHQGLFRTIDADDSGGIDREEYQEELAEWLN